MARVKNAKPTGAEMRATRDRFQQQADPVAEAERRERSILQHFTSAREDFDWIAAHEGWSHLGFATMTDWWAERVQPAVSALALRPAPEMARKVIDIMLDEQAALPPAQQRSKKEIARLVGVHRDTVSGRKRQDRSEAEAPHGADLDETAADGRSDGLTADGGEGQPQPADPPARDAGHGAGVPGKPRTAAEGLSSLSTSADGAEDSRASEDAPAAGGPVGSGPAGGKPLDPPADQALLPPSVDALVADQPGSDHPSSGTDEAAEEPADDTAAGVMPGPLPSGPDELEGSQEPPVVLPSSDPDGYDDPAADWMSAWRWLVHSVDDVQHVLSSKDLAEIEEGVGKLRRVFDLN